MATRLERGTGTPAARQRRLGLELAERTQLRRRRRAQQARRRVAAPALTHRAGLVERLETLALALQGRDARRAGIARGPAAGSVSGSEASRAARDAPGRQAAALNSAMTLVKAVRSADSGGQSSIMATASRPMPIVVSNSGAAAAGRTRHRYARRTGCRWSRARRGSRATPPSVPGSKPGNCSSRLRATSAVMAMSPPENPITSTRRPGSGPPACSSLSVSHSAPSVSQRAMPAWRQNTSNTRVCAGQRAGMALRGARGGRGAPGLHERDGLAGCAREFRGRGKPLRCP